MREPLPIALEQEILPGAAATATALDQIIVIYPTPHLLAVARLHRRVKRVPMRPSAAMDSLNVEAAHAVQLLSTSSKHTDSVPQTHNEPANFFAWSIGPRIPCSKFSRQFTAALM
jgi:hypothetical protein